MKKGPLVRVELSPGRYVKMYQADAIAQGLIEAPAKSRPAGKDKMRPPELDKMDSRLRGNDKSGGNDKNEATSAELSTSLVAAPGVAAPEDDFTAIDGVGPATARALAAHGIETFEELHDAGELDFLNAPLNAVIESWRAGADSSLGESDESGDVWAASRNDRG